MKFRGLTLRILLTICSARMLPASDVQFIQNGAVISDSGMNIQIQFYSENIVRVMKWPVGGSSEKLSLSVIAGPSDIKINMEDGADNVILRSPTVIVRYNKEKRTLTFSDMDQRMLLMEKDNPTFEAVEYSGDKSWHVRQNFVLSADEGIYGLGQHQHGLFNYRGESVTLVQTNTDAVTPFLISTRSWGMLWDNYSKTVFTDDSTGLAVWSDVGDQVDYYFISGKDMDGVIREYRYLTGQAPLYGKWAYGYWQSKEHYHTGKELLDVAKEYRLKKIPVDNIVQDWNYWDGNDNWSQMFFDETRYPRPAEMVKELHDLNYHMMISIWPGLGPKTPIHKDMAKRGYLFNTIGWAVFKYYDAFNPKANDLYWFYLKNGLYSKGIDAFWIDSTEPDIVNATCKKSEEYEMKKVGLNYLGSWARYLNAYSLAMMDALYKNQRQESDKKRVYMLTRSAYAGQQRSGATTWSGDIGASWEIYKKQIAAGINFSMSGIPYWTFDIGAFVLGAYEGVFCNGGKDPAYQELYNRMFQFGAFCPVFRAHGSETPREIWEFGEFTNSMIEIDKLRYRLLPYIYSLAWKVTSDGYTMMRGLPMEYVKDKKTYSIDDQYLFGPSIMVCPVTEYQKHKPPGKSILVSEEHFQTPDGKPGILAQYYLNPDNQTEPYEQIEKVIDHEWYTGRSGVITDSTFAVRWSGKLIPTETGLHQFHMKSYDSKKIFIDGKELPIVYTSVEQYTAPVELTAGQAYDFVMTMENRSTGAAKMRLFWKTPSIFAEEKILETRPETRQVYLPEGNPWIDFWTGKTYQGGGTIDADAPVEIIPLYIKAGSILPMGPFVEYAAEKPADPLEIRIYPGADADFTLYEDENDNYNYEKGVYATIAFHWDDATKILTIGERKGTFPGMLAERTFEIVLVGQDHGAGIQITSPCDQEVRYAGHEMIIPMQ